ncbi:Siderochrome iron transporter 2 [Friedmanniomyces endolithicus]|uniref:Siderochrome iron transporter 2 n=1 Tax=Friedmanniomyces endolithicus TaxID=329885 RepID=A0AAN6KE70_9PEZI|nr:Siderochrome iron transporter 2 [Friedmanniomyces endolithicus]KAK0785941.1 Siderochrome iron transporter 2 [Friedmanniomyces endolithicus]KAK0790576.1 Siderochrome iron transporter 2 [Friedmanniomyces endolithicus]KAK0801583.1 Siderochrome iron transporter 2 [Friedmanniomyces endolithicus]KAK0851123.1 Siderochrome iron transporter 2 [Friedmanniomyces endolithicus]
MGFIPTIRLRKNAGVASQVGGFDNDQHEPQPQDSSASDSDTLSLEARNEKEVQLHPNEITRHADLGVKKAEAAALIWGKKTVWATYAWIWLCFFMLAFQQSIQGIATVAAYADFETAPAITTASILANIIGGVLKLPIAKTLNLWGRAEGYLVMFAIYLIGIIVLAASTGPNSYAAGYVLYWIGYDQLYLIMDIFVADVSGLRNRAFAFAFVSTPFICTAFTGPLAAQSFLTNTTWRWALGAFAIIQPFVFIPLALVFKWHQRKAEKMGLFQRETSGRSMVQSILHYLHEFDVVGAILLMAAFVLFLLPFSLETYGKAPYGSATFIAMVVIGFLLFFVFAAWERWLARTHFIRWELFKQPTVLGACVLSAVLFFSFYCWDLNYYSFVKVVYALPISEASYMVQIYNVGSTFWGVVFGVWIRYTKHFKYTCLFFGLPLMMLGAGLMVYFRGADKPIGYLIMCQIFIAFGGGTLVIGQDMAVMSAADRSGIAMMLSLISLASSVGGAIGDAVAGAIFSATFPTALARALPAEMQGQATALYLGGYTTQEMFVPGTPVRVAIDYAWAEYERYAAIAAVSSLAIGIPAIAVWKNYRVDKQQNKGTVI